MRLIPSLLAISLAIAPVGMLSPIVSANHVHCSDGIDNDNDGKTDFPQDPQCGDNEDSSESEQAAGATVITLTDNKTTIKAGDTMIYLITLKNTSTSSKTTDLTLTLHPHANLVSPSNGGQQVGNIVRWQNITLPSNQESQFTVQVSTNGTIPDNTELKVDASADGVKATDITIANGSGVPTSQQFSIIVTDNRDTVKSGETLNYSVRVKNNAPSVQTTSIELTVSEFTAIEELNPPAPYSSNKIVWSNVTFDPNQERVITFKGVVRRHVSDFVSIRTSAKAGTTTASDVTTVRSDAITSASSSSSSSSRRSSSSSSSSRSTAATTQNKNVLFTKTADSREIIPGGSIRYTLYVQNVLLNTIDDAVISDRFDPSLLSVVDSGDAQVLGPGQLQWNLPRLAPGEIWQRTYTLSVSSTLPHGTQLGNIASIAGSDVSYAALNEKVSVVKTGVVQNLPSTGAPFDVIFLGLTVTAAVALSLAQRKRA